MDFKFQEIMLVLPRQTAFYKDQQILYYLVTSPALHYDVILLGKGIIFYASGSIPLCFSGCEIKSSTKFVKQNYQTY